MHRMAEGSGEQANPSAFGGGETQVNEEELARRVEEIIEALRPVLEGLTDDPSE